MHDFFFQSSIESLQCTNKSKQTSLETFNNALKKNFSHRILINTQNIQHQIFISEYLHCLSIYQLSTQSMWPIRCMLCDKSSFWCKHFWPTSLVFLWLRSAHYHRQLTDGGYKGDFIGQCTCVSLHNAILLAEGSVASWKVEHFSS